MAVDDLSSSFKRPQETKDLISLNVNRLPFYTIFILEIRSILGIQKQGSACSNSSSQTVCLYIILAALEKRTAMFISFSFLCQTNSAYSNHRQQLLPSTSPVSLCKQPFPMWASAATFLFFLSTLFKTPSLIFLH